MELLVYSQNNRHIVVNADRLAAFPFHSNTLLADHTLWVCTYTWPFCDKPLYHIKVKKLGYMVLVQTVSSTGNTSQLMISQDIELFQTFLFFACVLTLHFYLVIFPESSNQ